VQFDPELLAQLKQSGVMPGNAGVFSVSAGSYVLVQVDGFGEGIELPNEVASHIFVTTPALETV
jgi:DtxR family Mn-dependent transcriptional regulator